jgi:hypothetical protein
MGRRNQADVGTARKRPRRGAAALQSPVLNVLPDPPSSQAEDAPDVRGRKVLGCTQQNVPQSVRSNEKDCKSKTVVKESAEYRTKLQTVQQVCDAIDAEGTSLFFCNIDKSHHSLANFLDFSNKNHCDAL